MSEWAPTIAALIGLALCWIGLKCLMQRDKRQRAERMDELVESFGEAVDELKQEVDIAWAIEQSKHEVKH